MKLFLDSANFEEAEELKRLGLLAGVNLRLSSLLAERVRGERAISSHVQRICSMAERDVLMPVQARTYAMLIDEGVRLAAIHPNIVLKVPVSPYSQLAISWFVDNDIRTACSQVKSPHEAMLAAKAGAVYLTPEPAVGIEPITAVDLKILTAPLMTIAQRPLVIVPGFQDALQKTIYLESGADIFLSDISTILAAFASSGVTTTEGMTGYDSEKLKHHTERSFTKGT